MNCVWITGQCRVPVNESLAHTLYFTKKRESKLHKHIWQIISDIPRNCILMKYSNIYISKSQNRKCLINNRKMISLKSVIGWEKYVVAVFRLSFRDDCLATYVTYKIFILCVLATTYFRFTQPTLQLGQKPPASLCCSIQSNRMAYYWEAGRKMLNYSCAVWPLESHRL